jgi:hypothetical protein
LLSVPLLKQKLRINAVSIFKRILLSKKKIEKRIYNQTRKSKRSIHTEELRQLGNATTMSLAGRQDIVDF